MHEVNQQREVYFYGNVGLTRSKCPRCHRWCIVLNNKTACCGIEIEFDDGKPHMYRAGVTPHERKPLGKRKKGKILKAQGYRCLYCLQEFGSVFLRNGHEEIELSVEFDHCVPFAYNQDNSERNYVAACQVCNRLKSNFHYRDLEQAREDLALRRKEKGYDF